MILKPSPVTALPKCLLITAARNEERHLEKTILAMLAQSVQPAKWIIVNDGSTDKTPEIIDRYAAECDWMERFNMPGHRDRSFAAKESCVVAPRVLFECQSPWCVPSR